MEPHAKKITHRCGSVNTKDVAGEKPSFSSASRINSIEIV